MYQYLISVDETERLTSEKIPVLDYTKHEELQKKYETALRQKDSEIRALDMQVHKPQTSLDVAVTANERLQA